MIWMVLVETEDGEVAAEALRRAGIRLVCEPRLVAGPHGLVALRGLTLSVRRPKRDTTASMEAKQ